ncbi:hypothetical protein LHYA1_G005851 [Lachnellula hyalina]|uniref:EthD domain-containing protein n=1 Tax=Lachnellula hyalina TaxID=1316788 RepID=A0A8H8QZ99_9HELO|nr:uncharacterized protein LHYA1_G005851 [Lachnellula hyalina]TVY24905.1 hypothetical protein LHYA1_G005851 [Lachnellula hyalina]
MSSSTTTPAPSQALLKRNPSLTPKQFSTHWYEKHAQLIVPFFLHCGVEYYAQIHAALHISPSPSSSSPPLSTEELSAWDGAAEAHLSEGLVAVLGGSGEGQEWVMDYYREVVLVDELRFLVSNAGAHMRVLGAGSVGGETRVVIEGGKSVIEVGGGGVGGLEGV